MDKMNCIWLNEQNPYDILCRIQDSFIANHAGCVLEALTLDNVPCPKRADMSITENEHCHLCIQKWMVERGRRNTIEEDRRT